MISILRPRRGKKATAETQNIVLKRGEVFFESPDTGVGTGTGRIKIGDGTTPYKDLPYFIDTTNLNIDVDDSTIEFDEYTNSSSYSIENIINNEISSGKILKNIISAIKYVLYSLKRSINQTDEKVTTIAQVATQHENDIGNLITNVNANSSNISSLNSKVSTLESNNSGTLVMQYVRIKHPTQTVYCSDAAEYIEENKITNFFGLILKNCNYPNAEILSFVFMGGGYLLSGTTIKWQQGLTMEIDDNSFKNNNGTIYINQPVHEGSSDGSCWVTDLFFQVLLKI